MSQTANVTPVATYDAAVVGAGPVGLTAALAFARSGLRTALVLRAGQSPIDLRTAALFPASVRLLDNLGVWRACAAKAAPLRAIRILDDTSWMLRAPETVFEASEIGEPALAWNVTNAGLVKALSAACDGLPLLDRFLTDGTPGYEQAPGGVVLRLSGGEVIQARLIAAADGRNSPLRAFSGISSQWRRLEQTAIVATFAHSRPHGDVSTEIHRDAGPLTTVPLPGNHSSLVWVERPREAERLTSLGGDEFLEVLHRRLHGMLGRLSDLGPRMSYPLQWLEVEAFAANRIALVGEAAHVLPPIGAQGLNLGLRDAAGLTEAAMTQSDPGAPEVLAAYDRARRGDTRARGLTVDLLNRSLEAGTLPLQLARGLGMFAMKLSPVLKRVVMRHGAGGLGLPPRLMREAEITPPHLRQPAN